MKNNIEDIKTGDGKKYYALFRMMDKQQTGGAFSELFIIPGDEWKVGKEKERIAQFIKIYNSASEVADRIGQEPQYKYSLMHGEISSIEPHIQIFMDGRNLRTANAEGWA